MEKDNYLKENINKENKKRLKRNFMIAAIVVLLVAVAGAFIYSYQNQKLQAKEKNIVMTVDGEGVSKKVFSAFSAEYGIKYVDAMLKMGMISDVSAFSWDEIETNSKKTYAEFFKEQAFANIKPLYTLISAGKKMGILWDETDDESCQETIDDLKEQYGNSFAKVIKDNGYYDEKTLFEVQKVKLYAQKVSDYIGSNLEDFETMPELKEYMGDDKVTVKHILIEFEKDENGQASQEAKDDAKRKADEVFKMIQNGENFEELIEMYSQDPGQDPSGYTFADDGSMVQEFADASFGLSVGEVSEPVESIYGYHIIKRYERQLTVSDYVEMLNDNASVSIETNIYSNLKIPVNLEAVFNKAEK